MIWKEILYRQAARPEGTRGAIFITNDRKEDWWLRKDELLLGPRPELVREYLDTVGDDFYMYTPVQFLKNAPQFLQLTVSQETIADVGRISTTSPVAAVLRFQRMVLPEPSDRLRALAHIYEALASGRIQKAADLQTTLEALGESFASNYVEAPLFFSLISQSYGPVVLDNDASMRLRDRPARLREVGMGREAFIRSGHAAWLAQALFRVRHEGFRDEDLLIAFFGEDYSDEAPLLLKQGQELVSSDVALGGR